MINNNNTMYIKSDLTKKEIAEIVNLSIDAIDGIYASGDIIKKKVYQIVTAASDGSIAALSIIKDLK